MSGQRNLEGSSMANSHQPHCPFGVSLLGPHSNWADLQYPFAGLSLLAKWQCPRWLHFHFVSAERLQCSSLMFWAVEEWVITAWGVNLNAELFGHFYSGVVFFIGHTFILLYFGYQLNVVEEDSGLVDQYPKESGSSQGFSVTSAPLAR